MKTEENALSYLYGLEKFGILLGLDNIKIILELLGNPQNKFPTIHIVGTNGKGSTAAFLNNILLKAGYKVGRYTSPHLIDFSERITIGNRKIAGKDIVRLAFMIKDKLDHSSEGNRPFTFFEVTTALAFQYFAEKKVDIAIIEAGLGGRLDATNVIMPLVTVITNIGLEHKEFLGETIEAIASEKAAVIKRKTPVVTAATDNALKVIDDFGKNLESVVYALNRDFYYKDSSLTDFDYYGVKKNFKGISLTNLVGLNQFENASLALAVVENLEDKGFFLSESAVKEGIKTAKWEGRFEYVRKKPPFIIDGAHNPHGVDALVKNLQKFHPETTFIIILNVLKDKDVKEMVTKLEPFAEKIIMVKNKNERSCTVEDYKRLFHNRKDILFFADIPSALREVLSNNVLAFRPILFTGSLYGIGEAKEYLKKQKIKLC